MLDYKLIITVRQLDDFYAQEECAVARLAINLKLSCLNEKLIIAHSQLQFLHYMKIKYSVMEELVKFDQVLITEVKN